MLRFYIDNQLMEPPPMGWQGLEIELSIEKSDAEVSVSTLEFTGEWADYINDYIELGKTTGYGIFEGINFRIEEFCDSVNTTVLDGILDTTQAEFSCNIVRCPIKKRGGNDFLNEIAASFSFAYLQSIGHITETDFIPVNYYTGKYPKLLELGIGAVGIYVIQKEIREAIKDLQNIVAHISGGLTGPAAGAIYFVAVIAYILVMIAALVTLVLRLLELLFPFVYYHKGMLVLTMCQKACAHLGLGFSSTILTGGYARLALMPPKNNEGKKVGLGNNESGAWDGTFSDLLSGLIELFNAKVTVINGTVYLEQEQYFAELADYDIPDIRFDFYGTNAAEIKSNYIVEFSLDSTDLWSYENADFNCQATQKPIRVGDKRNNLLKGLQRRSIPFTVPALKLRKTVLETTMAVLYNLITGFAQVASKIAKGAFNIPKIPLSAPNAIQMDSHFTGTPRIFIYDSNGKASASTTTLLSASYLYQNYHYTTSAAPYGNNAEGNQWIKRSGIIGLSCEDFAKLQGKNYARYKGKTARILSLKFNPSLCKADIEFEVNERYTNNLEVEIFPTGNSTI